ncbi:MAG: exopolyphosphatase-like protein phosphoesterase RecJ protein [Candidatus Saccharibacteria bacterium]|nr:exopolyphosphatase-like protein phosphoesterase RecJ protein [Candidatus Saccharibacteria bacterium]
MLETNLVERDMRGLRDFILKLDVSKSEVDKLRYEVIDNKLNVFVTPFKGNFAPSDVTFDYGQAQMEYDLAIVLGVPTRARIDRVYEQNMSLFERIPVINLDFHRSNENYGAVNLIEPNASSLCEMLVALAESLQGGIIDDQIATALLMGIVGSTDRFTAAHTTSKSLTVAAQMMAAGARQQAVVKALYKDGKGGGQNDRNQNKQNEPRHERNSEPRHERQQEPRPERQQEQRQPAPQPEPAPVVEPQSAPLPQLAETRAENRNDLPLPIIDPGHIEMMAEPEPEAQPHTTALPSMQPMADFAAASEILAQRQGDDQPESERS